MMVEYTVIGGGIAGIISVSVLYNKYPDSTIKWIDNKDFNAGDLIKYPEVPANTPFKVLVKFIEDIYSLLGFNRSISEVCDLIDGKIFKLGCLTKELVIISNFIKTLPRVEIVNDHINEISYKDQLWELEGLKTNFTTEKLVLTTGCVHKKLNYTIPEIPIDIALNPLKLNQLDIKDKNIVVFGNSHSGILVLKNLFDMGCKNITNIVKESIRIPYFNEDGIEVYQESGIRGIGLQWAKENLTPENKTNIRIINFTNIKNLDFDYVIYSVGLKKRHLEINYNGEEQYSIEESNKTGLLSKHLYGLGVAFPSFYNLNGDIEYEIGMAGFLLRAINIL